MEIDRRWELFLHLFEACNLSEELGLDQITQRLYAVLIILLKKEMKIGEDFKQ